MLARESSNLSGNAFLHKKQTMVLSSFFWPLPNLFFFLLKDDDPSEIVSELAQMVAGLPFTVQHSISQGKYITGLQKLDRGFELLEEVPIVFWPLPWRFPLPRF